MTIVNGTFSVEANILNTSSTNEVHEILTDFLRMFNGSKITGVWKTKTPKTKT